MLYGMVTFTCIVHAFLSFVLRSIIGHLYEAVCIILHFSNVCLYILQEAAMMLIRKVDIQQVSVVILDKYPSGSQHRLWCSTLEKYQFSRPKYLFRSNHNINTATITAHLYQIQKSLSELCINTKELTSPEFHTLMIYHHFSKIKNSGLSLFAFEPPPHQKLCSLKQKRVRYNNT